MVSTASRAAVQQSGVLGIVAAIARLLLGGVFAYAALTKLAHPARLADDIANYRIVPAPLVPWLAALLPGIELVAGVLLVVGVFARAAASLAALMLGVFMVAIGQAMVRGLNVDCGCFGGEASADTWAIGRNLVLLTIALFVAVADRGIWSIKGRSS
jgi:uncharacterized membrane protein YphA (DoxX/SURF4 family)